MENTIISWSDKGGHINGSKQGFTTRTLAESAIECEEMGIYFK